jgi:hypothetical protein
MLFGSGTRMFKHLGSEHIPLETVEVIETAAATHLRFGVVKSRWPVNPEARRSHRRGTTPALAA